MNGFVVQAVDPASVTVTLAGFPVDRFLAYWWVFPAAIVFSTVAIATSVFTLAIAAAAGALVHALTATPVWYVVAWSIPGVLVGGTNGTRLDKYLPSELLETGLGVVFALVGLLVLGVKLLS